MARGAAWQTGAVNRADIIERIRGGVRLPSRWAWAADAALAVLLSLSTVNGASRAGDFAVGPGLAPIPQRWPYPPIPPFPPPYGYVGPYPYASVSPPWWLLILAAATALPLVVRRRYPLMAYGAVLALSVAFHWAAEQTAGRDGSVVFTFVSCLIAGYSAAVYSRDRRALAWGLTAGVMLLTVFHTSNVPGVTPGFLPILLLVPAAMAANTVHTWRQRVRRLEREREAATLLAVERERARIARELHDVVTHNVSMMTVQAGAARKVMAARPDLAREALLAVEGGGRAALAELRHVMGLLTMSTGSQDPAAAELAPQPGLDRLEALAGRIRDTGVPVDLVVSGTAVPLPPGADLAAYRVVQEALTNTVKHAVGAAVTIRVEHRPDAVRIEVADTGGAPSTAVAAGEGRGLIGLRERLAVHGGTLDAGRRVTGGFRVRAVIPVEAV